MRMISSETVLLQLLRDAGLAGLRRHAGGGELCGDGAGAAAAFGRAPATPRLGERPGRGWVEDDSNAQEQLDRNYLRQQRSAPAACALAGGGRHGGAQRPACGGGAAAARMDWPSTMPRRRPSAAGLSVRSCAACRQTATQRAQVLDCGRGPARPSSRQLEQLVVRCWTHGVMQPASPGRAHACGVRRTWSHLHGTPAHRSGQAGGATPDARSPGAGRCGGP